MVGLSWPTVFQALAARPDVVEGVLDLVHLEHRITGAIPAAAGVLDVAAAITDVSDTEVGRVVSVEVSLTQGTKSWASLGEPLEVTP